MEGREKKKSREKRSRESFEEKNGEDNKHRGIRTSVVRNEETGGHKLKKKKSDDDRKNRKSDVNKNDMRDEILESGTVSSSELEKQYNQICFGYFRHLKMSEPILSDLKFAWRIAAGMEKFENLDCAPDRRQRIVDGMCTYLYSGVVPVTSSLTELITENKLISVFEALVSAVGATEDNYNISFAILMLDFNLYLPYFVASVCSLRSNLALKKSISKSLTVAQSVQLLETLSSWLQQFYSVPEAFHSILQSYLPPLEKILNFWIVLLESKFSTLSLYASDPSVVACMKNLEKALRLPLSSLSHTQRLVGLSDSVNKEVSKLLSSPDPSIPVRNQLQSCCPVLELTSLRF